MATRNAHIGWTLKDAETSTGPCTIIRALHPLRWVDHPLLDLRTALQIPYPQSRPDGLADYDEAIDLHRFEEALRAALGPRGPASRYPDIEWAAYPALLHRLGRPERPGHTIDRFADTEPQVEVTHTHDAGWTMISPFT
jgi:hypothetical protein